MGTFKLHIRNYIKNKNFGWLDFRRCKTAYAARPQVALYSTRLLVISYRPWKVFSFVLKCSRNPFEIT